MHLIDPHTGHLIHELDVDLLHMLVDRRLQFASILPISDDGAIGVETRLLLVHLKVYGLLPSLIQVFILVALHVFLFKAGLRQIVPLLLLVVALIIGSFFLLLSILVQRLSSILALALLKLLQLKPCLLVRPGEPTLLEEVISIIVLRAVTVTHFCIFEYV